MKKVIGIWLLCAGAVFFYLVIVTRVVSPYYIAKFEPLNAAGIAILASFLSLFIIAWRYDTDILRKRLVFIASTLYLIFAGMAVTLDRVALFAEAPKIPLVHIGIMTIAPISAICLTITYRRLRRDMNKITL
ncbi:hypothetical protein A3C87_00310 [Candidatus Kaiserbacteria bacterium RIFCSPHIGHO2_02_FULL_49_34]|uniref:Uncharacterized protein n=1 Tax=Candidatus Kaiserbacteria bacterium RIFCSPHIGHO2_02_FULL_49_34 TaxID=1798491 RepID=A0A1F6DKB4_9BACT|nr:MAG: hypothetical protein A3C87_00310 [Candidatus Kaiserbacteria bacterium RIFCSPHIGHO2_02_FULL_49_34]